MRGTYAFDAANCRPVWSHHRAPTGPEVTSNNKGGALAGGRVIRGTQDGHLFALDMRSGGLLWDRRVADSAAGEYVTAAPIVWRDIVFVGKAGGELGIVGEMMAFRAGDGTKLWGTSLVASGNAPGADSWQRPESARTGGGSTWSSYSLDAESGVLFVPVGNPAPDFNRGVRPGDNLYTNSLVALDARTGALRWWYQLVPGDDRDWDTTTVALFEGRDGRRLVAAAGKDGVLHVLDRAKGTLLFKTAVTTRLNTDAPITPAGTRFCPGASGGVAWNGPGYHPGTGAVYVNAIDWCTTAMLGPPPVFAKGEPFTGLKNGRTLFDPVEKASGWTNAVDAANGKMVWRYHSPTPMLAAVTPTAGGVLFTADLNGDFLVLDAGSGKVLYRFNTGAAMAGGVVTYELKGRQYVGAASGNASRTTWYTTGAASVFVFGL
jgi:PQQ-dependent dehydrogenase (methanol/ethanol family)